MRPGFLGSELRAGLLADGFPVPLQLSLPSSVSEAHRPTRPIEGWGASQGSKWPEQPLATLLGLWRVGHPAMPAWLWVLGHHQPPGPVPAGGLTPGEAASLTVGSSPCLGGPHSCPESGGSTGMSSRQPGRRGSQAQADPRTGEPGACPSLLPPLTRLARLWGWRPTLPSGPQPGWGPRDLEGPRRPHCPGHPQPPAGICSDSLTSEPGVCTAPAGSGPGSDTTCLHLHSGVRPLPGGGTRPADG